MNFKNLYWQINHSLDSSNFDIYPEDRDIPPDESSGWDSEFWHVHHAVSGATRHKKLSQEYYSPANIIILAIPKYDIIFPEEQLFVILKKKKTKLFLHSVLTHVLKII